MHWLFMLCRSHTLNLDYLQYRGRLKSASQGRRDRDPGQLVSKYAHECLASWVGRWGGVSYYWDTRKERPAWEWELHWENRTDHKFIWAPRCSAAWSPVLLRRPNYIHQPASLPVQSSLGLGVHYLKTTCWLSNLQLYSWHKKYF